MKDYEKGDALALIRSYQNVCKYIVELAAMAFVLSY